jgi:hypothetical protein
MAETTLYSWLSYGKTISELYTSDPTKMPNHLIQLDILKHFAKPGKIVALWNKISPTLPEISTRCIRHVLETTMSSQCDADLFNSTITTRITTDQFFHRFSDIRDIDPSMKADEGATSDEGALRITTAQRFL